MANIEKYKEQARKFELKEQWAKALDPLIKAIEEFEASPENDADLALYNRVGDLYVKLNDATNAIQYYERAVDQYYETGLVNNAIALCNKVMRLSPGRAGAYLKLGMLFAKKGFMAEAKQNLLEYADRMQKGGQTEEAFKALKKFAEMTPGQDEIWTALAQQARAQAKTAEQREQLDKLLSEFDAKDKVAQQRRSRMSRSMITGEMIPEEVAPKKGELIFLDIDDVPRPGRGSGGVKAPPPPPPRAAPPPPPPLPPPTPEIPVLEIEPTAIEEPEPVAPVGEVSALEVEPTSLAEPSPPATDDLGLEPTSLGVEPISLAEPELEPEPEPEPPPPPPPPAPEARRPTPPPARVTPAPPPAPRATPPAPPPAPRAAPPPPPPPPPAPAEPEREFALELEPELAEPEPASAPVAGLPLIESDFDLGTPQDAMPDVPEVEAPPSLEAPAATSIEFMDLGAVEELPKVTVKELQKKVRANPEDWDAHQQLGEALLEEGEREEGLAELNAALEGFDAADNLEGALRLVEEILRLDPNSVRYQQKRVELSYRSGDRAQLVDAYVELADALLRSNEAEKAISVYQRVLEHDAGNLRARTAIETLAPAAPAGDDVKAPRVTQTRVKAEPKGGGDYVDLGAMLLDNEGPKDLRMRIEDEEPTGDEQKDFQQMLAAFKKGIEANVEETDFQSHYDLGVAYKEMGLLDEAIAEFQKALRSADGRLKSSEALGLCFFEKGQHAVAETILRRALEHPAAGDAERVGVLYWLGRTLEEQDKRADALAAYNRVFAVEIQFQDVNERVRALVKAGA